MRLFLPLMLLAFAAAPATAAHYRAEPAAASSGDRLVLNDTVWQLNGGAYEAGKSNSRPAIVCARLAKEVGQLRSFSVAGAPIGAEELEKCNAKAGR